MLIALIWWSYLLIIKNKDAYNAKIDLIKITKLLDQSVIDEKEFINDIDILSLKKKYKSQEKMIMGEAIVLAITLLIGIWFINRAYRKQVETARQSRNFLLSITHELKSPISSIKLILQTFSKRKLEQEKIHHFSDNAIKETERLEDLVNNLLLAAKLENTFDIHLEEVELFPLLDGIKENILSKNKNVTIHLNLNENILVLGDKMGLISIFINIIENAIKYSYEKKIIHIEHKENQNYDIISIADNGIGIPNLEKNNIFSKFYRIGNEDTRKTKGTGLGLYIVNQIIESHKGKITVENNQPQGSIFTIFLPK